MHVVLQGTKIMLFAKDAQHGLFVALRLECGTESVSKLSGRPFPIYANGSGKSRTATNSWTNLSKDSNTCVL